MNTRQLHYISGLVIAVFITLHLFNHLTSLAGAENHILWMERLRLFYRNIIVEAILLTAVVVQIVSGFKLYRSVKNTASGFFQKLHIYSGLYLAFFLSIHVSAVLAGRFVFGLDTNFYFGAAGINTFPHNLFFVPYYALAVMAVFAHFAAVHHKKMKAQIFGLSVSAQSYSFMLVGIVLTAVLFYGLTNGFAGVAIPQAYGVILGK